MRDLSKKKPVGAPPKYGERMVMFTKRVPKEMKISIGILVQKFIDENSRTKLE